MTHCHLFARIAKRVFSIVPFDFFFVMPVDFRTFSLCHKFIRDLNFECVVFALLTYKVNITFLKPRLFLYQFTNFGECRFSPSLATSLKYPCCSMR
jgi:hypothetical protein